VLVYAAEVARSLFQSAPGGEAGGNPPFLVGMDSKVSFNPPPAVRPGGTYRGRRLTGFSKGFNPPPAVRPGGTIGLNRTY